MRREACNATGSTGKSGITELRISRRSECELVRRSDRPLHPLDGPAYAHLDG